MELEVVCEADCQCEEDEHLHLNPLQLLTIRFLRSFQMSSKLPGWRLLQKGKYLEKGMKIWFNHMRLTLKLADYAEETSGNILVPNMPGPK